MGRAAVMADLLAPYSTSTRTVASSLVPYGTSVLAPARTVL